MNKKTTTQIFFALIILCFTTTINAQVTIGSNQKPLDGALLQLTEGATTTKGLGLPRVKLTNLTPTTPTELAQSVGASDTWDLDKHIGLLVYNTNACVDFSAQGDGLYIWNGNRWQSLKDEGLAAGVYEFTDDRDNEVYLARNFGSIAGDWMLESVRYVPDPIHEGGRFNNYVHSAASSNTNKHYVYAETATPTGGTLVTYILADHPSSEWPSKKKNGILYNWPAAINMGTGTGQTPNPGNLEQGQASDGSDLISTPIRGICPDGWHLPSDKEWNDLEREIYNNAHLYSEYTESEKNAWIPWSSGWEYGFTTPAIYLRPNGATDSHAGAMLSICEPIGSIVGATEGKSLSPKQGGFNAIRAGAALNNAIGYYGDHAYFWTASSSYMNNNQAWVRYIIRDSIAYIDRRWEGRRILLSVRCKKD
ncbi:FISUMP domain-containing protein [Dysgonomonas sp. 25]|uniref:FISUMP domain-containing protein n=1 Tax=Dysgonomonas sp. 25 TaxID=2302933 RepID=UPI0013D72404|nr:FISUMP domain-containing protein [Dysgonomonas sp. 25]NDV68759.1 hypothetical protein [Dysgonomonas sp. 25]